jgi:hypothetical protein
MKAVYDVLLLAQFQHQKPEEELTLGQPSPARS